MFNDKGYKERLKAEYWETKIRYENLHKMIVKYETGTLNFKPACGLEILKNQARHMGQYLHCLEIRAEIEKVDLEECSLLWDGKDVFKANVKSMHGIFPSWVVQEFRKEEK